MYAVCLGIVLVASSLLGIFPVEAGIVYGRLSAYDPDYFWISNVNKGNYVEIIIQADTWPYDWESKMCYSNLTLVKRISGEDTHIYEFIANETDDYLLRLFADFSFNYTIECTHNLFPQLMGTESGNLSINGVDYFWISNVTEGDLVLLNIQADTWPYKWESKLYYSNLTLIERIFDYDTHIYEFIANETDDYLLRLFADFSLNYTIECNHLVTLAGDIDCDGDVDYRDLFILARAYGSSVGQPSYVANADIICNGVIDYKDLFHLARNYGKNAYKD